MPPHDKSDDASNRPELVELRYIRERVNEVHELLTGNGRPDRGLVVRVDRLEQTEARRTKVIGVAVAASAGALVKAFWATISGGGHSQS